MAKYRITSPEGEAFEITAPEDASEEQVMQYAQQQWSAQKQQPEPGFGEKANAELRNIPRQLGLAARYGVEGMADVAGIAANPLAATINATLGTNLPRTRDAASAVLDRAGLPKPATPTERVVGDASRILAGGGGMVKGAQAISGTSIPVVKPLLKKWLGKPAAAPTFNAASQSAQQFAPLAARPGLQAASAVGSGGAGGYTRETGGDPMSQFVMSVLGGVAAPGAVAGVNAGGNFVRNTVNSIRDVKPPQLTVNITNAIEQAGYNPKSIPKNVMNILEEDAAAAMRKGELSQDALRRLVDYRLVGATPARGNLTLNPVDLTKQHNLSKIGANSSSPTLQGLAMRQNENTGTLLRNLNEMGANTTDDAFAAGQRVIGGLEKTAGRRQGEINAAYTNARNQTGLDAEIDPAAFTQRAGDLLKANLLEGSLPPDVRRILNDAATGKMPLNVSTAEQIKTAIGNLQRSSADGSVRKALGYVRQALDEAPLLQGQGDDAIQAFNAARGLNRNWRGLVEKTPALQAIEDGVQPDKFVQQYIIQGSGKANVMDVARLKNAVKDSPEALQAIRGQILAHLKSKATSGKPDEAMTFSQSGYNNAFSGIGERKLRMFFTKPEIDRMKAVGRVAMYEQTQVSGSAVNNSNTAAMAISKLDDMMGKIPVIGMPLQFGLTTPAKNITTSIQAGGMTNVPKALNLPQVPIPGQRIPLPLLMTPGLLEDRRN